MLGPPLPPYPNLKVLNSSQLELQWDIPYSNENYPIWHFNVHIKFLNTNSRHEFVDSVVGNRYMYMHNTEDGNAAIDNRW